MSSPTYAYFRDKVIPYSQATVGVLTHGLNYGTGCFAGIRGYWNANELQLFVFRPVDHYTRFLESAKLLRMELQYTPDGLTAATLELLRKEGYKEDCYIRPIAFYADEIIGVRLHNLHPLVAIASIPMGGYLDHEDSVSAMVSAWRRVDDTSIPARGKITGAYVNSAFAKSDAYTAGFDDAILLNQDGHVSEGSAQNLLLVRRGVVITPPITDNILEGIVRRTLMLLLRDELGVEVVERPVDRSEIYLAEECMFVGTGVQIAAVTSVDHRKIGSGVMGPVTHRLKSLYMNVVRGAVPKYRSWCVPVFQA